MVLGVLRRIAGFPAHQPAITSCMLGSNGSPVSNGNGSASPVFLGGNNGKFPKHLSPSSVSLFKQCQRRWKFRYIDRLPDPPGQEALAGTFAHSVLEDLLKQEKKHRTQDCVREIATKAWPSMANSADFRSLKLDADAVRAFKWQSWKAIQGLWDLEDPAEVDVEETELRVQVDVGGVPFLGFVDRIEREEDGLVISDYKSGRPPPDRFESRYLEQVLLYAAAVSEMEYEMPARVRLMYLGNKIIEEEVTPERIDEVVERLVETWDDMLESFRKGEFPANVGKLCGWCVFSENCPEGSEYLSESRAYDEQPEPFFKGLSKESPQPEPFFKGFSKESPQPKPKPFFKGLSKESNVEAL